MYQNFDQNQMGPAARVAQPKQPSAPQKTKFTVDDLKEIMGVIMPAIDYPGPLVRSLGVQAIPNPPAPIFEPSPMVRTVNAVPVVPPPAPRVRIIPNQTAVVPPGYYE